MIIVLKPGIAKREEAAVLKEIRRLGYRPHIMRGVVRTVIGAIGDERTNKSLELLTSWSQVESVTPIQKRFKLVSREAHTSNSTVDVRGHIIGGRKFQVMAGPCSVESEKQLLTTAHAVKKAGATLLRGGQKLLLAFHRTRAGHHLEFASPDEVTPHINGGVAGMRFPADQLEPFLNGSDALHLRPGRQQFKAFVRALIADGADDRADYAPHDVRTIAEPPDFLEDGSLLALGDARLENDDHNFGLKKNRRW